MTYESAVIVVSRPECLDAGNIIPKEMKFDGLDAECFALAASRWWRRTRCQCRGGCLLALAFGVFGTRLEGVEFGAGD
jgi:hypothetical protein